MQAKITHNTTEHRTVNGCKRIKSDPVLYNADTRCSVVSQSPACDNRCQTVCTSNGKDANTFRVSAENCTVSSNQCQDNSQYVALDCEFVGVGPRLLSALGMFVSD